MTERRRPIASTKYVFLALVAISLCSFIQTKRILHDYESTNNDHLGKAAIETSLDAFRKGNDIRWNVGKKKEAVSEDPSFSILPPQVVEDPISNPTLANGYDTFSACLLVMDDNHRLVECKLKQHC